MRKLITIALLLISGFSFAQPWQGGLSNTIQRLPTDTGYDYRIALGSSKGVFNMRSKEKQDSILNSKLPVGLKGQILKVTSDNVRKYYAVEPLTYGQFIYTDAQKTRAFAAGSATQLQIFNTFKRFAHGGNPSDPIGTLINGKIPVRADQTNSWAYDTVANVVKSTINAGSHIGFFSREGFSSYIHDVTLSANSVDHDNDRIGVVIAFVEDSTDMVVNQAYGLNPGDFNWPINVTDSLIPNQHTLTLFRERESVNTSYIVRYDYNLPTSLIIANGSSMVYQTTAAWNGVTVDVEVKRIGDTITVKTTNFSDAPGGKGSLGFPMTFNLNSNPALLKFKGAKPYGYSAQSQADATYSNISFSGSKNVVYDLRTGATYPFTGSGYVLDPSRNMYNELGNRFFWRNKSESTYGYILPDNTYDVIVGETP